MKKIHNPYTSIEGYNCFACSPGNRIGLKMEFFEEGDYIICNWQPNPDFEGYHNLLHGGIQATLMDEIAAWLVNTKIGTGGVTARMETRFKKPVLTHKGDIKITARLKELNSRIASIDCKIFNNDGSLAATSTIDYFILPLDKAKETLAYPGKDAFYD